MAIVSRGKIVAGGMLREGTPIEDYTEKYGLWVKREDLSCLKPGPAFSKTRGVYQHILNRPEKVIGVLDTYHSQAGHAVARACQILGKQCVNFYPEFKYEPGHREPQKRARALGAELVGIQAGRSAILFHDAKKRTLERGGYMMPNALKLDESVVETAKEVPKTKFDYVLIPVSSGTLAAGVVRGFYVRGLKPKFLIHMGYSRSHAELSEYIKKTSGVSTADLILIDEEYQYKDQSKPGMTPEWGCNPYYDLKAFRWWLVFRSNYPGSTLFWNIG